MGHAYLFRNEEGSEFTNIPVNIPKLEIAGAVVLDFDNDGIMDLYVQGKKVTDNGEGGQNRENYTAIWRGTGDPDNPFEHAVQQEIDELGIGESEGQHRGYFCAAGDYDNDGWTDLFMTGWARKDESWHVILYRNNQGVFEEVQNPVGEDGEGIEPFKTITTGSVYLSDLNKDGLRVIAICEKNVTTQNTFSVDDENNMVLTGFIGFLDPPKESAKMAIKRMNEAGIRVIVLTGDNAEVTNCICKKVGIKTAKIILGSEIDKLPDSGVIRLLKRKHNVFAKLSPIQKARIIRLLKTSGNVVGYMGDGINDTPSLTNSDVGVSVDTAVDIAKETADIILLEKDLNVLLDGVTEGRKTFSNLLKYIKLAVSFNFGEVTSVLIASILLPFFPITPIQLLVQSLLYDIGQLTLPFDNVDIDSLKKPKKWSIRAIRQFMIFMGPLSSAFDLIVFAMLWFVFKLGPADSALFQTIWFSYGIVSNLFGMHIIRTAKIPFVQSHASKPVYLSSIIVSLLAIFVPFTALGSAIGLVAIPLKYMALIFLTPVVYCIIAQFAKYKYIQKHGEWL